jgi:hypothetical protein
MMAPPLRVVMDTSQQLGVAFRDGIDGDAGHCSVTCSPE